MLQSLRGTGILRNLKELVWNSGSFHYLSCNSIFFTATFGFRNSGFGFSPFTFYLPASVFPPSATPMAGKADFGLSTSNFRLPVVAIPAA